MCIFIYTLSIVLLLATPWFVLERCTQNYVIDYYLVMFATHTHFLSNFLWKRIHDLSPTIVVVKSTLCEVALQSISQSNGMGIGVNYEDLTNKLIDTVFPDHFKLEMTEEKRQRVIDVSGHYSKGRGKRKQEEWKEDSVEKDESATPKIKAAAELFLYSLYNRLETGEID